MKSIIKPNKRALSELVSYVLLVIITLSISVGVYTWLKAYMPAENERAKCPEEAALTISNYNCFNISNEIKVVQIKVENKGFFDLDGFYIRASNDSNKLPTESLDTIDVGEEERIAGQYFADLKTGTVALANFSYTNLTTIKRIQIQPIYNTTICANIANLELEGC